MLSFQGKMSMTIGEILSKCQIPTIFRNTDLTFGTRIKWGSLIVITHNLIEKNQYIEQMNYAYIQEKQAEKMVYEFTRSSIS